MLEQFYNLKVFQVLKDEKVYQLTLDKRIIRLNNWKAKVSAKSLKRGIEACINLTKEADQTAKKLLKARTDFVNAYPFFENLASVLDSVIEMQDDGLRSSDSFKEWSKYKEIQDTAEKIRLESRDKAREIVLEALEGKVKEDISLLELINKRALNYNSLMLAQLKSEVYLQYSGVQSLSNLLTSCPPVVETLDLYRGFLYMGIINIEGGKLDQKAFWDRAKSIGENAIGFIPVVGNFVGAIKMTSEIFKAVQEFRGVDVPEVIDEAQFVELFMNKYQIALGMWIVSGKVYIEATKGLSKSLKKYKISKSRVEILRDEVWCDV